MQPICIYAMCLKWNVMKARAQNQIFLVCLLNDSICTLCYTEHTREETIKRTIIVYLEVWYVQQISLFIILLHQWCSLICLLVYFSEIKFKTICFHLPALVWRSTLNNPDPALVLLWLVHLVSVYFNHVICMELLKMLGPCYTSILGRSWSILSLDCLHINTWNYF